MPAAVASNRRDDRRPHVTLPKTRRGRRARRRPGAAAGGREAAAPRHAPRRLQPGEAEAGRARAFGWGRERMEEKPVPGLYLYGGVGRGKSMLMDLFFEAAPVAPKRRVHFHGFMQEIHAGIAKARAGGATDPVRPVADAVADGATLLCFDEMQITDITDAMLVGRLFERLFERGRRRRRHLEPGAGRALQGRAEPPAVPAVHRADQGPARGARARERHRPPARPARRAPRSTTRRSGRRRPRRSTPPGSSWRAGRAQPLTLNVQGRDGHAARVPQRRGRARPSPTLCGRPLGPADYLAIAEAVEVLILDDVPVLSRARNNEAKRFVTLIDALYEAKVRLDRLGRRRARRALSRGRGRLRVRPHRLAPARDAERRLGTLAVGRPPASRAPRPRAASRVAALRGGSPPPAPDHERMKRLVFSPSGAVPVYDRHFEPSDAEGFS